MRNMSEQHTRISVNGNFKSGKEKTLKKTKNTRILVNDNFKSGNIKKKTNIAILQLVKITSFSSHYNSHH